MSASERVPIAKQLIKAIDEHLAIGRESEPPVVGSYRPCLTHGQVIGRAGVAWDDDWRRLGTRLDELGEKEYRLAQAMGHPRPGEFYSGEPKGLDLVLPKDQREFQLTYLTERLGYTEAEAKALLQSEERTFQAQGRQILGKPQWPGYLIPLGQHIQWFSAPEFVRALDLRLKALRDWAQLMAGDEPTAEAASAGHDAADDEQTLGMPESRSALPAREPRRAGAPDSAESPRLPTPGRQWGDFWILKEVGTGGQVRVFLAALRKSPQEQLILKVPREWAERAGAAAWPDAELEALLGLDHPGIVKLKHAGEVNGVPYVTMEYIRGVPLSRVVPPPSLKQALSWMIKLTDAVRYAHRKGVAHRDIKPDNIILGEDAAPRLIDFGLASVVNAYQPAHCEGVSGTFAYMAPEIAKHGWSGQNLYRADIFSLGGVLKYLLTQEGPYGCPQNYQKAAESGEVKPATGRGGLVTRRVLCRIANRATRVDPKQRYSSADAMNRLLWWVRFMPWLALGMAALVVLAAGGADVTGLFGRPGLLSPRVEGRSPIQEDGAAGREAPAPPVNLPERLKHLPALPPLVIVYTGSPPEDPVAKGSYPQLSLDIKARRKGQSEFVVLRNGDALASKVDDYVITVHPMSQGFLYVFQIDSSGNCFWLFPKNPTCDLSSGQNLVKAGSVLQIPSAEADRVLFLDTREGVEHVYAVFSAVRWPELEESLQRTCVAAASIEASQPGGFLSAGVVQKPNELGIRGIGGIRPSVPAEGGEQSQGTVPMDKGKQIHLPVPPDVLKATGPFLVIERWFHHVGTN